MTGTEYQKLAQRTMNLDLSTEEMIVNALLGLSGEVGEINDYIKKHKYQGHQLVVDKVIEEAGDVMWYIALLCTALYTDMDALMERNIDKLKKRYPNGFDSDRSINREEEE
jgi:NTP pyrophosphatase (non-canonical NTP hydrolase)